MQVLFETNALHEKHHLIALYNIKTISFIMRETKQKDFAFVMHLWNDEIESNLRYYCKEGLRYVFM